MLRRRFLILLGAAVLASLNPVYARNKVPRIGVLASGNLVGTPQYDAFVKGLRELGYVEGKNIHIEHRWIERDLDRLPSLAAELVRLPVDLILAWGTPAVGAAKQATTTVPIVMIAVADPVAQGFVASLAKPGGNITGMSNMLRGTIAKNVEMLTRMVPGIRRIALLRNPSNGSHRLVLQESEQAARDYGLEVEVVGADTPEGIDSAFAALRARPVQGMVVFGDPMFMTNRVRIADLAKRDRLPTTTIFRQYPEAGGLLSYGLNTTDMFRREAYFVDKILKGARPADLPVEHPTTYEMVINLKTARAIGLQVPESLLLRADRVIE